jgi:DNA-directed RNA polymerase specialized sigma24 family protein
MKNLHKLVYLMFFAGYDAREIFRKYRQLTFYDAWRDLDEFWRTRRLPCNVLLWEMLSSIRSTLSNGSCDAAIHARDRMENIVRRHETLADWMTSIEQELIKQAKAGGGDAFDVLIRFYEGVLFGYFGARVSGRVAVEELVQETRLDAKRKIKTYNPQRASFAGWLRMLGGFVLLEHFRRTKKRQKYEIGLADLMAEIGGDLPEEEIMARLTSCPPSEADEERIHISELQEILRQLMALQAKPVHLITFCLRRLIGLKPETIVREHSAKSLDVLTHEIQAWLVRECENSSACINAVFCEYRNRLGDSVAASRLQDYFPTGWRNGDSDGAKAVHEWVCKLNKRFIAHINAKGQSRKKITKQRRKCSAAESETRFCAHRLTLLPEGTDGGLSAGIGTSSGKMPGLREIGGESANGLRMPRTAARSRRIRTTAPEIVRRTERKTTARNVSC